MTLRVTKMHGAGNDFVIVDCRKQPLRLSATQIARMGDRHFGIGFDQLLTIEPARDPRCVSAYGIFNQDGSPATQCGNGVRCVAAWLHRAGALNDRHASLEGPSGAVAVEVLADGRVRADMGAPRFAPGEIPLLVAAAADSYHLVIDGADIAFAALSIGNPHALIEVVDVAAAPVGSLGPRLATHSQFPQGCNVGFAQVVDRGRLLLRVWERGAGATLACGTGACAAVVVLRRRGKLDATVQVELPGGTLEVAWNGGAEPVFMTGPAEFVFDAEYLIV